MNESTAASPEAYHLYGRKTHPQPLTFVGRLEAPGEAGVKPAALKMVGEAGWVELIAFPVSAITRVIPGEADR